MTAFKLLPSHVGGKTGRSGGECRGLAGGFAQVAYRADALYIRQAGDGAGIKLVGELAVEGVGGDINVATGALSSKSPLISLTKPVLPTLMLGMQDSLRITK